MEFAPRSTDGALSRRIVRFVGIVLSAAGVVALGAGGVGGVLSNLGYAVVGLLVGVPAVAVGVPLSYFAPGPVTIVESVVAAFDLGRLLGWLAG